MKSHSVWAIDRAIEIVNSDNFTAARSLTDEDIQSQAFVEVLAVELLRARIGTLVDLEEHLRSVRALP